MKELQKAYFYLRHLESRIKDETVLLSEQELSDLQSMLKQFSSSDDPFVSHLSQLEKLLLPQMTARSFLNLIIPFERALNRSTKDPDFLITTKDKKEKSHKSFPLVLVLDNLRSAFNVGSIFRTAEALGAEKIFLCGYTPTPDQESVKKTTMGAEHSVNWIHTENLQTCLSLLKQEGYYLIALETALQALPLQDSYQKRPTAFILGNERFGIESTDLKKVDEVRKIELFGQKNSLNVGVTAGIALHEWIRQWNS